MTAPYWVDFPDPAADKPIHSGLTVRGWGGNLERIYEESGWFVTPAFQSDDADSDVFTPPYYSMNTNYYTQPRLSFPVILREKEDGGKRSLRFVFRAKVAVGTATYCRIYVSPYNQPFSAVYGAVSVDQTSLTTFSTTISGIETGTIRDLIFPAVHDDFEPAICWVTFAEEQGKDALTIESPTIIEVP